MKIAEALKKYDYEKFGMSDELILEGLGFDEIYYPEDLQTYINEFHWEMEALEAEAQLEFDKRELGYSLANI